MNTSQLKAFAQESRKALMDSVSGKLEFVLAEDSLAKRESKMAVSALEGLIKEIGKEQVIEKVAYTWFNRFCALRFMDANRYTKIGTVSPVENQTQPEILAEAKMNYIDENVVSAQNITTIKNLLNGSMTSKDPQGEAYKLLLVSYCNSLNKQLPFMFERINDYTELLMPDDLLSANSVLSKTVAILDAETCKDVEVIGWLYQYYISEKKDEVFADLKKGKKISKENVPAATQIFTPKWIVKYMVENSVGKLWLESHPDSTLQSKFKYYLESAEQDEEVKQKLEELKNKNLQPQEIKVLDPACGSGHILVVAFSVLFEIYKSQGWQENEIPEFILRNNLFGLDICDRAAQMAQFAVMMKAREHDRNIFNKVSELNICSIKDTDWIDLWVEEELLQDAKNIDYAKEQIELLKNTFMDAKEYGSILEVRDIDFEFWDERLEYIRNLAQQNSNTPKIRGRLPYTLKQAKIMQQQYECVISNPPYMGNKGMSTKLSEFVKKKYPNAKSDMSTIFMEKTLQLANDNGYMAMINIPVWMFLASYENLRNEIVSKNTIINMLHLGRGIFGSDFGTTSFVINKKHIKNYIGSYRRLYKKQGAVDNVSIKEQWFLEGIGKFYAKQEDFQKISGIPIVYWASNQLLNLFREGIPLEKLAQTTKGLITGENNRFLRFWSEVEISKIKFNSRNLEEAISSRKKWFPCNKGGIARKWYGNNDYVINYENDGQELIKNAKFEKRHAQDYYSHLKFKSCITWSSVTSGLTTFRYKSGDLVEHAGMAFFPNENNEVISYLGFVNSNVCNMFLQILSPTLNINAGEIDKLPILKNIFNNSDIKNIVKENIQITKDDWDSFETSWDFKIHPLLRFANIHKGLVDSKNSYSAEAITVGERVEDCFKKWESYKQEQFNKLKANEEELNRLFIEIYGLQDEMTPEVDNKDITITLADEKREIKSLLSYAVGCMFGRYSLDEEGLVFAGGEFDISRYRTFPADEDAVIPVLEEHLFADDITSRFKEFLKVAFKAKYFDENLEYVAKLLGKKNTETADDTIRNYFTKDFYNDHLKTYQKRPIYWMFSTSKGSFNALVYMHRYNKNTASMILNSYLRNYRDEKLKSKIEHCKQIEASALTSQSDKIKAQKDRDVMEKIVKEVTDYEHDILYPLATKRKEIDLDDGVKVNYLKFGKALKDFGLKAK